MVGEEGVDDEHVTLLGGLVQRGVAHLCGGGVVWCVVMVVWCGVVVVWCGGVVWYVV